MKDNLENKIVREMLSSQDVISRAEIANLMGISNAYFNNKMDRGSWTFSDILAIAKCCGYSMNFVNLQDESKNITPSCDEEVADSINEFYSEKLETAKRNVDFFECICRG